jgi:hypothetical protein
MKKIMTWAQIKTSYRDQWVYVNDPEMDGQGEILRGEVLFHSKSRAGLHRQIMKLRSVHGAVRFTGPLIDEGVVAIL